MIKVGEARLVYEARLEIYTLVKSAVPHLVVVISALYSALTIEASFPWIICFRLYLYCSFRIFLNFVKYRQ